MTPALSCTHCSGPRIERSRDQLADALRGAVLLSLRETDPERRHRCLTAHLLWFESELRGRCTNCTLQEAADELAAVSVEVLPPLHVCRVIPMRPRAAYEGSDFFSRVQPTDSNPGERK